MGCWAGRVGFAAITVILGGFPAGQARAANGAYAVDAADISETGSCKVESWMQGATNTDFSMVANPSCVVDPFKLKPVELSMQSNEARSGGDWSATFSPKAKMNLVPTGVGKLGLAFSAGSSFDALSGQNQTVFATIPATFRLTEVTRINLNGGWLWDRTVDQHYFTYGIGFDWKFTDVLQWTIEAYGQAGQSDTPSVVRPRFQTGVRYRPNEIFSLDLIYGHNITGENANWITLGTTIRFPVPEGRPARERTGHL